MYPSQQVSKEMKKNKERDKLIVRLYKPGMGGTLGKMFEVSRQRVFQIRQEIQPGIWRRLWNLIRKH